MSPKPHHVLVWRISISGYGSFSYIGTEAEAEEMKVHKARWEGMRGSKTSERSLTAREASLYAKHGPECLSHKPYGDL